jgi:hypothetical protein
LQRCRRRTAGTPGLSGIAIDQVSKYKYLGVVYQEDGSWQARARRLQGASSMGTGGHCCHAAVCRQRSDCSWFRPSSIPRHVCAEVWRTTKAVKDKMSAVVRSSPQHSSLHPETALLTFCTGTLGYFHPVYSLMLPNCGGSTDTQFRLADGQEALRFSFEGSRGVSRLRWARTGAVMAKIHY